jgi:hypothetical protein
MAEPSNKNPRRKGDCGTGPRDGAKGGRGRQGAQARGKGGKAGPKPEQSHQSGGRGKGASPPADGSAPKSVARMANACRDLVWKGYERFQKFDGSPSSLLSDPVAAQLQSQVSTRSDVSQACVWLALAAHCNGEDRVDVLKRILARRWGVVTPTSFEGVMHEWARLGKATCCIYIPEGEKGGMYTLPEKPTITYSPIGARTKTRWNFLQVPTDAGYHLLPLGWADTDVLVDDPFQPPAVDPPRPAKGESSAPLKTAEVAEPSAAAVAAPPQQPDLVPVAVGAQPPEGDVAPAPKARGAGAGIGDDRSKYTCPRPARRGFGVGANLAAVLPTEKAKPAYEGPYPPPDGFEWVGENGNSSWLRLAPRCVAATTEYAARWAYVRPDMVYYAPPPLSDAEPFGFRRLGRRGLTDGLDRFTYFMAGDRVTVDGDDYTAVKCHERQSFLRLIPADASGPLRTLGRLLARAGDAMTLGILAQARDPPNCTVVPPIEGPLDRTMQMRIAYDLVRQDADPRDAALVQRGYQAAQECGWGADAPSAYQVAALVKSLREHCPPGRWGYSGGKPFDWGYCYSCGSNQRRPRLPGRLCRECRNATPAARAAAIGMHVTSVGKHVYPGVVETLSQHPPLKRGKETLATSQCFQVAP